MNKIDEYKSKINYDVWEDVTTNEKPMQSYFKRQLDIPCIDICIVGDDDCCVACGRTVVEMAIVSDAEKL